MNVNGNWKLTGTADSTFEKGEINGKLSSFSNTLYLNGGTWNPAGGPSDSVIIQGTGDIYQGATTVNGSLSTTGDFYFSGGSHELTSANLGSLTILGNDTYVSINGDVTIETLNVKGGASVSVDNSNVSISEIYAGSSGAFTINKINTNSNFAI